MFLGKDIRFTPGISKNKMKKCHIRRRCDIVDAMEHGFMTVVQMKETYNDNQLNTSLIYTCLAEAPIGHKQEITIMVQYNNIHHANIMRVQTIYMCR